MSAKKIKYTDEPLGKVQVIPDFLPSPSELAFREEGVKVMRKAKQKPVGRQPALDIGAELLTSVREMKAGIRARVHRPKISEIAHARLAARRLG